MILKLKIPRSTPVSIQWLLKLWGIFLIIFTVFRILTVGLFKPAEETLASLLPSFWLGLKYDAKWISIILLPIAIFSLFKSFSPFYSEKNKKIWTYYLAFITLIVLFFFGADIGNFAYNHTRINASALNFAEDPAISFKMLWQSYPMVWILLGLIVAVILIAKLFNKTHIITVRKNLAENIVYRERWHVAVLAFMLWCIYGIFSLTPLKWNDAFVSNDNFRSYLALNPLQNFFTTLRFRRPTYDDTKVKEYYPLISSFLGLDSETIKKGSFEREIQPRSNTLESRPNIVVVLCESFSMYKSSMSGNPLNTTPYFNRMCKDGIFFDRCFSPTFGTARGAFALITGIPDVQLSKFSTRNVEAINQRTIVNDFEEYDKFYFLGGSSGFNNFEGLVKNIEGIKIYQDSSYKSKPVNVWGISDKNLFLEANDVLSTERKPFFAIIQTADNHRPYTIPEEDKDFVKRVIPSDTLSKYGFESLAEFNAFCYTDYCYSKFIEAAKKQPYFNNTIFVFIGDHGVEGEARQMYPDAWTKNRLSDEHVPFLIYSPSLVAPLQKHEVVSQIDLLPTLAGLIHQPYTNTTLGRDMLNPNTKNHAAFIIHHDEGNIGVITDDYYYVKNLHIMKEELVSIKGNSLDLTQHEEDSVRHSLSQLSSAFYETARWMLVNNKRK
jgi:phosphoglycerol transferase MdoB-like AlkP superfamily enzyme